MVVSGRRMNVFVNDATSPTLEVGRLEGDAMKGALRLQGPGTFANMVITRGAVDGLSPEPVRDPLDGDCGTVRNWRLTTFSALPNGKDHSLGFLRLCGLLWRADLVDLVEVHPALVVHRAVG